MSTIVIDAADTGFLANDGVSGDFAATWQNRTNNFPYAQPPATWWGVIDGAFFTLEAETNYTLNGDGTVPFTMTASRLSFYRREFDPVTGEAFAVVIGTATMPTFAASGAGTWTATSEGPLVTLTLPTALENHVSAQNVRFNGSDAVDIWNAEIFVGDNRTLRAYAGGGNDTIYGGAGSNNIIDGGTGDDFIMVYEQRAGGQAQQFSGGDGKDEIYVINNDDDSIGDTANVDGGAGDDRIQHIGAGTFYGFGGKGNDRLDASENASDHLAGGGGNDTVYGNHGDDTLDGGLGNDLVRGLDGDDRFVIQAVASKDRIEDFGNGDDALLVSAAAFGLALGAGIESDGSLSAEYFDTGRRARVDHAVFLYDDARGVLLFDADGRGGADAIRIVYLSNQAVDREDFLIT